MPLDKRNIVLVGMPSVGKSTIGVLMAKRLRYNFTDTDITIQVENDGTLAELIAAQGNDGMLAMEERVLLDVQPCRTVIATGGSACYSARAMAHLATTGPVVYLRAPFEEVAARVGDVTARGVVMPEGFTFRDLYDQRCGLYEKYATITVDIAGLSVEDSLVRACEAIAAWMEANSQQ